VNREKLLQNPMPIDRVAYRVIRAAKPENLWRPMPKDSPGAPPVGAVLATAPTPWLAVKNNPEMGSLIGKRRDRMTVLGYAAEQGAKGQGARWVVRCDCGNQEYRGRVFRWLGTAAPDMCRECQNRAYKLRGEWSPRDPAVCKTSPA
jgi:hypothetical protein